MTSTATHPDTPLDIDTPADLLSDSGAAPRSTALQLPLTGLDQAFARYLQSRQSSTDPRHALLAALTSYQFGRGHACLDLDLLARQGVAVLGWDLRFKALLPADLSAAAATLPWAADEGSPLVLDGARLYLRRNWSAEASIRAAIAARMQQVCAVPANLPALLEQLFPPQAATGAAGAPDWQKVACALAARKRLTLITGGPGTGKTTTVVRLLALLQAGARQTGRALRVALAAPTGKAAARLGESIASAVEQLPPDLRPAALTQAVTLHKLLQIRPHQTDQDSPALAVDLVIVDEASMIDLEMMARLLAAVPLTASLVLLGDKDQLASVEAGAVMAQLCEGAEAGHYTADTVAWLQDFAGADVSPWSAAALAAAVPVVPALPAAAGALAQQTVMLRFSRRFKDDSGIGIWAKAVNAGACATVQGLWRSTPEWASNDGAVVDRLPAVQPQDARLTALVKSGWSHWRDLVRGLHTQGSATDAEALDALRAFAGFQVLCAVREGPWGVELLNRRIATGLGFKDEGWYAGRPVMVTRNDYNLALMNGDVGLCLPHAKGLRVAFADGQGGIHWVLPSRLDAVESVFAMTVHKSQGSEFAHVCLVLPDKPVAVLTRELLYTGITRARARLSLVVPQAAVLWQAVDSQVLRSGGLAAG